ncbi:MAG: DUF4446 family protein [Patescibacteria group bacterium]|nr:DUF4446 family protein [Patescibacteria group bacterium]
MPSIFSDLPFLIVIFFVFAWLGAVSFLLLKIYRTFARLTKGVNDHDLKTLLGEILKQIETGQKNDKELSEKIAREKLAEEEHLQKLGLVRYNPFADTGGNQSFVLALLDGHDNGLVITSLHSREATRVFAKPVMSGKEVGFEFSKEEIQAIIEAKKKKLLYNDKV